MRGRLRSKDRKLQRLPGYRYVRADGAAEIDRLLDAFFALKSIHMAQQGPRPTCSPRPAWRSSCATPVTASYPTAAPLIELHALESDAEVLALFAVVVDEYRFSSMFNTYTLSDNARHSPGLILLRHMVGRLRRPRTARLRSRRRQGGLQIGLLQRDRAACSISSWRSRHSARLAGAGAFAPPIAAKRLIKRQALRSGRAVQAAPPLCAPATRAGPVAAWFGHAGRRHAAATSPARSRSARRAHTSTVTVREACFAAVPASAAVSRPGSSHLARDQHARAAQAGEPVEPRVRRGAGIDHDVVVAARQRLERDRQPLRAMTAADRSPALPAMTRCTRE